MKASWRDLAEQPGPGQVGRYKLCDPAAQFGPCRIVRNEFRHGKGQGLDHAFGQFKPERPVLGRSRMGPQPSGPQGGSLHNASFDPHSLGIERHFDITPVSYFSFGRLKPLAPHRMIARRAASKACLAALPLPPEALSISIELTTGRASSAHRNTDDHGGAQRLGTERTDVPAVLHRHAQRILFARCHRRPRGRALISAACVAGWPCPSASASRMLFTAFSSVSGSLGSAGVAPRLRQRVSARALQAACGAGASALARRWPGRFPRLRSRSRSWLPRGRSASGVLLDGLGGLGIGGGLPLLDLVDLDIGFGRRHRLGRDAGRGARLRARRYLGHQRRTSSCGGVRTGGASSAPRPRARRGRVLRFGHASAGASRLASGCSCRRVTCSVARDLGHAFAFGGRFGRSLRNRLGVVRAHC